MNYKKGSFSKKSSTVSLMVTALLIGGCGGSDLTTDSDQNEASSAADEAQTDTDFFGDQANTLGGFSVLVRSAEDSSVVQNGRVRLYHADTGELIGESTTNLSGTARFDNITSGAYYNLSVSHPDYTTTDYPLPRALESDKTTGVEIVLSAITASEEFAADEGGTIEPQNADGATVTVPPNAFVGSSGGPVSGSIRVSFSNLDEASSVIPDHIYESAQSELPGGERDLLFTYGATDISFFDSETGEALQLADDITARIIVPLYVQTYQDGTDIEVGDSIGMWFIDKTTGIWTKEADGIVIENDASPTGLALQADVTHFTAYGAADPTYSTQHNIITAEIDYDPGGEGVKSLRASCVSAVLYYNTDVTLQTFPVVVCDDETKDQNFTTDFGGAEQGMTQFCIDYQLNSDNRLAEGYNPRTFSMGHALNNVGPIQTECYNETSDDIIPFVVGGQDGVHATVTFDLDEQNLVWDYDHTYTLLGTPQEELPGCVGNCLGGFYGGHIDVDTYTSLNEKSDHHDHEYDDDVDLTYVDYLNINNKSVTVCGQSFSPLGSGSTSQIQLSDVIDCDQKFVVLMNNADLSSSGILQIGENSWNVVEYQRVVHEALANWDPTTSASPQTLVDGSTMNLAVSLNDIIASGGTFRLSFSSLSLGLGGVHPTNTGEVKDQNDYELRLRGDQQSNGALDAADDGRRRDGSLMMQLIALEAFDTSNALSKVEVQTPHDMPDSMSVYDENGATITVQLRENGTTYGGLVVAADQSSHFLYSTTTFWHYDGDSWSKSGWVGDSESEIAALREAWYEGNVKDDLVSLGIDTDLAGALVTVQNRCNADASDPACDYLGVLQALTR